MIENGGSASTALKWLLIVDDPQGAELGIFSSNEYV